MIKAHSNTPKGWRVLTTAFLISFWGNTHNPAHDPALSTEKCQTRRSHCWLCVSCYISVGKVLFLQLHRYKEATVPWLPSIRGAARSFLIYFFSMGTAMQWIWQCECLDGVHWQQWCLLRGTTTPDEIAGRSLCHDGAVSGKKLPLFPRPYRRGWHKALLIKRTGSRTASSC